MKWFQCSTGLCWQLWKSVLSISGHGYLIFSLIDFSDSIFLQLVERKIKNIMGFTWFFSWIEIKNRYFIMVIVPVYHIVGSTGKLNILLYCIGLHSAGIQWYFIDGIMEFPVNCNWAFIFFVICVTYIFVFIICD